MKTVSTLIYEMTPEEVATLPVGFQFFRYDTLYGSLALMRAGENRIQHERRYVYFSYKEPPASWNSPISPKAQRRVRASARA